MEPQVGLLLLLLVVVGIVTFMSIRDARNKERIARAIRQAGGEPVKISFRFVGYDRDNQHYNVQFADVLGRKHETRCKINIWQSSLFWEQTPVELLGDLPVEEQPANRPKAKPNSSKEQLIDHLVAENERLREQLTMAQRSKSELNSTR